MFYTLPLISVFQVSAKFRMITTLNLEPKCMAMLDFYPKLLSMFQSKKGSLGTNEYCTSGMKLSFTLTALIIFHLANDNNYYINLC